MIVQIETRATATGAEVVVRDEDGRLLGVTQTDDADGIAPDLMARLWASVAFDVPPHTVHVVAAAGTWPAREDQQTG